MEKFWSKCDGCTTLWIYLMLLNCTLKMVKMVTFMLHTRAHTHTHSKLMPYICLAHTSQGQTLHLLPVCHWCHSNCYPRAEAQKEWVWVSLCVGSLRGTAWDSRSFFHRLNPRWFLQPEIMGANLPGTGTLGWGVSCGAETPHSQDIPPKFLSTTCGCGTRLFHNSVPPTSLDGCGFFHSIVIRLPFNLIFAGPEW